MPQIAPQYETALKPLVSLPSGWGFGTIAMLTLGAAIPLLLVQATERDLRISVVLPLLLCAYAGTRLGMLFGEARPKWLSIMFWMFCYVWMGLAGLVQQAGGMYPLQYWFSTDELLWGNLLLLSGFVSWDLGRWLSGSRRDHPMRGSPRKIRPGQVWLLATLVVLATPLLHPRLGGVLAYFRYTDTFVPVNGAVETLQLKGDYDASAELPAVVRLVDAHGLTYGHQALGAILFFVPRSIWPNKPIDTGRVIARTSNAPIENISAPLWVEGYISQFLRYPTGLISVLVPILAGYELILLRGSLLQAMGRLAVFVLLLLLLTKRTPSGLSANDHIVSSEVGAPAARGGH